MKVLVTGANGQVGWELVRKTKILGVNCCALTRAQMDITDRDSVGKVISEYAPDYVINAAAYTAVDKAEEEVDLAFAVNCGGASILAKECSENSVPLIHVSTDYVFDGKKDDEYTENDFPNPINVYGRSKWEGEEAIRRYCPQHIILRTSWVFGLHGNNFLKTMLMLAKDRDTLNIVNDQYGGPTPASAIADVLLIMLSKIDSEPGHYWGTYHFAGFPFITWFGFAQEIFKKEIDVNKSQMPVLKAVETMNYPTKALRPRNSKMSCAKIHNIFNIHPANWKKSLHELIAAKI